MLDDLSELHKAAIAFSKRAERTDKEILHGTFVDCAPLFDLVSTNDNQVIYGRRGTGKTHLLRYLQKETLTRGERAVYLDLRSIGSNTSIHSDTNLSLAERSVRLVSDVLATLYEELLAIALEKIDEVPDPKQVTLRIDDFSTSLSEVRVDGTVTAEQSELLTTSGEVSAGGRIELTEKGAKISAKAAAKGSEQSTSALKTTITGVERPHIHFGSVQAALSGLIRVLNVPRIWFLIDEWSEVPRDLQPYLAEMIRRTILPINGINVKIASIEHRSNFAMRLENSSYIGFELGADVAANVNLDEFLVFDFGKERSKEFFSTLILKHYNASVDQPKYNSTKRIIQALFTQ